jgi:tripartite-type tricarboxylate transporter receptor subunit TctC
MFTRRAALAAAAGVAASRLTDSWAQPAFPIRPVTIVAPFTPGTPADLAARRVARAMTGTLRRSVVVDNRVGAGGTTGSEYVARAEPDGYTLIAGTQSTHAINVGLYRNLRYHPTRSFAPISRISAAPNVGVVPAVRKVGTMTELIALAKQRNTDGQPLSFGSGGSGTTAHLGAEVFKQTAGINMVHIIRCVRPRSGHCALRAEAPQRRRGWPGQAGHDAARRHLSDAAHCDYAASLKSPICASSARVKAGRAVQRSI